MHVPMKVRTNQWPVLSQSQLAPCDKFGSRFSYLRDGAEGISEISCLCRPSCHLGLPLFVAMLESTRPRSRLVLRRVQLPGKQEILPCQARCSRDGLLDLRLIVRDDGVFVLVDLRDPVEIGVKGKGIERRVDGVGLWYLSRGMGPGGNLDFEHPGLGEELHEQLRMVLRFQGRSEQAEWLAKARRLCNVLTHIVQFHHSTSQSDKV
jgi:hypothetical protein